MKENDEWKKRYWDVEENRERKQEGRIRDHYLKTVGSGTKEVQVKVRDGPRPAAQAVGGEAALSDKD